MILLLQRGKVFVWFVCISWAGREGMAFAGLSARCLAPEHLTCDLRLAAPQACVASAFRFYLLHSW
ncbi:MAG TPA: hypothetical protein DEB15_06485 [Pusillimonas sp.]|nr:hypothetical protein [Pusillimonas sp.]MBC43960.1 hypothetical protein [Pusillimonas sp.]HBT32494.1 hypothetical protein [Pusillimonas sp.]HCN71885.1 hypothetical protein [Pusillimonas sp.]